MSNYFRITAYHPDEDLSVIMDSNGYYKQLWEFSAFLVARKFKIINVGTDAQFLDINIEKAEPDAKHIILRANAKGKPCDAPYELNGISYHAVMVGDKIYIPDKTKGASK